MERRDLEGMTREDLITQADELGVPRPRVLTQPELIDEILARSAHSARERARSRGFLGRARDLLARVVERGLHLPGAARALRGDQPPGAWPAPPPPLPTVTLAEIYAAQGHLERAIGVLDEVLAREPEHDEAKKLRERLVEQAHRRGRRAGDGAGAADQGEATADVAADAEADTAPPPAEAEAAPAEAAPAEAAPAEAAAEAAPSGDEAPGPPIELAPTMAPPPPGADEAAEHELAELAAARRLALGALPSDLAPPAEAGATEPIGVLAEEALATEDAEALAAEGEEALAAEDAEALAAEGEEALAAEDVEALAAEDLDAEPVLPERYDVDEVVGMAIDPETVYLYWEVRPTTLSRARVRHPDGQLVIRLVAVQPSWEGPIMEQRDVPIDALFGDRFVRDVPSGSNVRVSIGWLAGSVFDPFAVGLEIAAPRSLRAADAQAAAAGAAAGPGAQPVPARVGAALPAGDAPAWRAGAPAVAEAGAPPAGARVTEPAASFAAGPERFPWGMVPSPAAVARAVAATRGGASELPREGAGGAGGPGAGGPGGASDLWRQGGASDLSHRRGPWGPPTPPR